MTILPAGDEAVVPDTANPTSPPEPPLGAPATAPGNLIPDLIEVRIGQGGRAVVVSDLHLTGTLTEASKGCTDELVDVLAGWSEPGVLVIAGDGFEQLHEPVAPLDEILDAHQTWTSAIHTWAAADGHQVVVLSGNHDGNIAWDAHLVDVLGHRLSATMAIALDLVVDAGDGEHRVPVVHGNQDDPYNAFVDLRSPIDTPAGHHVVRQILPQLDRATKPGALLEGLTWLAEPMQAGELMGSRLLYRSIVGKLWWLAIPFIAAFVLRAVAFLPGVERLLEANAVGWLVGLGVALVAVLLVIGLAVLATLLVVDHALSDTELKGRSGIFAHNAAARERAARLVASGYSGLISGHTHQPELTVVGVGFYGNSGCGVEVVGPRPARFRAPASLRRRAPLPRVELAADDTLHVSLVVGDTPLPISNRLERIIAKPTTAAPTRPALVATLPTGGTWPVDPTTLGAYARMRRSRRWAAGLVVVAGILTLVSALAGPSTAHLERIEDVVPLRFPRAAGVLAVLIGVALIGLARSVRRGYRPAWLTTIGLLWFTSFILIVKGVDIEEGVILAAIGVWLLVQHRYFQVAMPGRARWWQWAVGLGIGAVVLAAGLAAFFDDEERWSRNLTALALGTIVLVAIVAARPGRFRIRTGQARLDAEAKARDIIERHGGDTLDPFAVRGDRALLFAGDGVVAYSMQESTMLVSPDPICSSDGRADIWAAAMDFADSKGWRIKVIGANPSWLTTYHAAGLHDVYLGDEALVVPPVELPAPSSVYAIEVGPASDLGPALGARLAELPHWPSDDPAQHVPGLSAGLERHVDRVDGDVVIAVARTSAGDVVGCQQYVAATAVGGATLDATFVAAEVGSPEAVAETLLVEAVRWLAAHGRKVVSLNLEPAVTSTRAARPATSMTDLAHRLGIVTTARPRYVVSESAKQRRPA